MEASSPDGEEAGGLPRERLEEALETVELKLARGEWTSLRRLRLRSFYTGTTYWLSDWDGSTEAAAFVDEAADLQAENVKIDQRHGPTPRDESPNRPRKRERRRRSSGPSGTK